MEDTLIVDDLRVQFSTYRGTVRALNGVSFNVNKGEMVGLAGETGSGKSVTGLTIQRLLPENGKIIGGRVMLEGRNLVEMTDKEMAEIRGNEITAVFQDPHTYLNPVFKLYAQFRDILLENDEEIKAIKDNKTREAEIKKRVPTMLREVKMPAPERAMNSYPHELSGGMKQRMLLAMAFALKPKLIVADEPTTALDVTIQAQVLQLVRELQSKYKTSVILITHDLGVIAENCDKIAVMYAGRVVEFGDVKTVYAKPMHPYIQGLMRALPRADKDVKIESIGGTVPDLVEPPAGCTFHPRCPYAMDVCQHVPPRPLQQDGRLVECHLYDQMGGDEEA